MNGVVAIGVVVGALGIILLIPGLILGRYLARKRGGTDALRVTRVGFLVYGALVLLMLAGLAIPTLIRGTWADRPGASLAALFAYYGLLVFAVRRVELALRQRGTPTLRA